MEAKIDVYYFSHRLPTVGDVICLLGIGVEPMTIKWTLECEKFIHEIPDASQYLNERHQYHYWDFKGSKKWGLWCTLPQQCWGFTH